MYSLLLIIIATAVCLGLLLKVWNKYSRKFNHNVLRNSACKSCGNVLGDESLNIATSKLEKEKEQLKREAKIGTVQLYNMELICPHCGAVNFEREMYKVYRDKPKISPTQKKD